MWLFLSYVLQHHEYSASPRASSSSNHSKFDRVDLLFSLVHEVYFRNQANSSNIFDSAQDIVPIVFEEDEELNIFPLASKLATINKENSNYSDNCADQSISTFSALNFTLYDSISLIVLSRVLQSKDLRSQLRRVITSLPFIPVVCLHLFELVMWTGTLPATKLSGPRTPTKNNKDKGSRLAALECLSLILHTPNLIADEKVFAAALLPLLWASVSDDFSLRSNSVLHLLEYD